MTLTRKMTALLFASVAFAGHGLAADISPKGADDLKTSLTQYLPKDVVDTGFLKVNPGTGRYEISVDWNALVNKFKDPSFTINGLQPMSMFASPKDGGLWQLDGTVPLNVDGSMKSGDVETTFKYSIESFLFSGIFDPAIYYMQTADSTAKNISFSTKTGESEVSASFGEMVSKMTSNKSMSGTLDLTSTTDMLAMVETITDPSSGPMDLKVDKVNTKVDLLGVKFKEIIAIVNFVLEHKDAKNLTPDETATLKTLLRAGLPFWNNLAETLDFNNVSVNSAMGSATLGKLGIGFHMSGATNDASFGFTTTIENPAVPEGILPPAYIEAIPSNTFLDVSMSDFHVADAANIIIDRLESDVSKPPSPEEDAALTKAVLGGDTVHLVLNKLTAKSGIYDVEMSGDMMMDVNVQEKVSAKVTILARDIDKTVDFLQKNADAVPEYGQAAFFAQMFKGFAVKNDDGRDKWVVEVAEDNSVKINGTPFGGK